MRFKSMIQPLIGRFHPQPRRQIRELFCLLDEDSLNLLDNLLQLNPMHRLTAEQALKRKSMRNMVSIQDNF